MVLISDIVWKWSPIKNIYILLNFTLDFDQIKKFVKEKQVLIHSISLHLNLWWRQYLWFDLFILCISVDIYTFFLFNTMHAEQKEWDRRHIIVDPCIICMS